MNEPCEACDGYLGEIDDLQCQLADAKFEVAEHVAQMGERQDEFDRELAERDATINSQNAALTEAADALESLWAAIGDALCSGHGIEKEYAKSVQTRVGRAARRARAALARAGDEGDGE